MSVSSHLTRACARPCCRFHWQKLHTSLAESRRARRQAVIIKLILSPSSRRAPLLSLRCSSTTTVNRGHVLPHRPREVRPRNDRSRFICDRPTDPLPCVVDARAVAVDRFDCRGSGREREREGNGKKPPIYDRVGRQAGRVRWPQRFAPSAWDGDLLMPLPPRPSSASPALFRSIQLVCPSDRSAALFGSEKCQ